MLKSAGALAIVALLGLTAIPSAHPQSVPAPSSVPGQYGVTLTVAEIMDRQRNAPPPAQGQSPHRHPRPGTSTPQKPKGSAPSKPAAAVASKLPQTVGTTFQGDAADVSVIFPPDCMGAVGPDQFLVGTNHAVAVYDKATGTLGGLNAATSVFFSAVLRAGLDAVDPRVRFDRLSQRWFVTSIEASLTTNNVDNRVLIAVSSGPHITSSSSFTFFFFEEDLASPAGDSNAFADYDTLGIDANALYIGCNIFGATGNFSTTGFVVQKSSVLGAGPLFVTAFRGLAVGGGSGIYTPQGVDNDDPASTEGYFIGPDSATASQIVGNVSTLIMRRISNPGSTTPSISGDLTVNIPTVTFFSEGVFTTANNVVDDLDLRLFMATVKNVGGVSTLWATHNIQYNNGSNDAVAWYKIGSLTTTPTLLDNGTIPGTNPTESCWMPSLAVTGQGHMVIGYNFTSPTERIGARMASHLATDGLGVTQPATLLQQSGVDYQGEVLTPGTGIARWGDYSYTSVDPNDNMTVWTIQELPLTSTAWKVQAFQLKAPPPPSLTSAVPSSIQAGLGSVSVTVTGTAPANSGQGFYEPGAAFPQHLVATLHNPGNGQNIVVNSVTVQDATHLILDLGTVGLSAGGFTLTVTNPDGQSQTSAGFVTIAGASATPSCVITPGASPTHANPVFTVTFSSAVAGLTSGNFVLTNAASAVLAGSGASYTLTVTPTGSGPEVVTCQLPAGKVSANTVSNTASVTFDKTPLTATITGAAVASNQNPLFFSVVFSKPVTGVVAGSFTTSSGSIGAVSGTGAYWSVGVSGPAQGTVTLTLPAGRVLDAAGNPNALATGSEIYDATPPVVTVTPPGPATNQSSISFTITLTDAYDLVVGGLTLADISVTNGTAASLTGTGPYTLVVNPSGQGTVTVQVNAGSLQDQAGNLNVGASGSTVYDTVPPNTSLTSEPPNPSGSSSATFTFASTKPGNNFQVQLDGGAVTTISTNTITYTGLAVGTHNFSVAAVDAAGNVDPTPATYTWTITLVVTDGAAPLVYSFDSQAFIVNWTVSAPTSGVGWEVDASPASILGAPPYFTAPASLNYNNGVDYNTPGVSNKGTARTPAITRTAIPSSGWVKFMCNYQTDNGATTDLRKVNIYQGSTATLLLATPLSGATCAAMGTWHEHAIALQNAWTPSISVEFSFDTVDAVNNTGAGWFVDDLEISDLTVSGLHQYPAGVGTPIPVGGATTAQTLDFKGQVSTVATSASLDIEVVPVATAFTGTPTASSPGALPPGQPISVRITVPSLGSYHWRARTVDSAKGTSAWMDFGVNQPADPDFIVVAAAAPPSGGGGGGGGGCGLSGLEGILILALLRRRARSSRA